MGKERENRKGKKEKEKNERRERVGQERKITEAQKRF